MKNKKLGSIIMTISLFLMLLLPKIPKFIHRIYSFNILDSFELEIRNIMFICLPLFCFCIFLFGLRVFFEKDDIF